MQYNINYIHNKRNFCSDSEQASCTSFSTFEQDIATVGEDGTINLLAAQDKKPIRIIGKLKLSKNSFSIYLPNLRI